MLLLEVITVFLIAVAMAMALSHALEFPGKMRLTKAAYFATQGIYYPGFTIGGGFGEGLGLIATVVLLLRMPSGSPAFWWTFAGLIALAAMHAIFWTLTQPVNKYWLSGIALPNAAQRFFSINQEGRPAPVDNDDGEQWKQLRNRWEYSHIIRAVLASISLISLTVAVAIYERSK